MKGKMYSVVAEEEGKALGYVSIPDADTVCDGCKCPDCGEARVDWLAWDEEGTFVTCASCGCAYVPA